MLKSPLLFAISVLVSLMSWTGIAQASDTNLGLTFALPPTSQTVDANATKVKSLTDQTYSSASSAATIASQPSAIALAKYEAPLPPLQASDNPEAQVPASNHQASPNTDTTSIGVHFAETTLALPEEKSPAKHVKHPAGEHQASLTKNDQQNPADDDSDTPVIAYDTLGLDDWIFEGGPNSLVAHTVGSAEGTRRWDGRRTQAYYGHKDPGNGVWNLGTFSYQHEANSPEDADKKQLKRLKNQGFQLEQQATHLGLKLSLEEKLNGLDLANQAPLAALGKGGYIERLGQAYRLEMKGFEAISWARTRAYIDPDTKVWNAPGLGNNLYSISQDQERRMAAIDKALRAYDRNGMAQIALSNLDNISLENTAPSTTQLEPIWDDSLQYDATDSTETDDSLMSHDSRLSTPESITISALEFGLPVSTDTNTTTREDSHNSEPLATAEIETDEIETAEVETLAEITQRPSDSLDLRFASTAISPLPNITAAQNTSDDSPSSESLVDIEPSAVLNQVMGHDHEQDNTVTRSIPSSNETQVARINPIATAPKHGDEEPDDSANATPSETIPLAETEQTLLQTTTAEQESLSTAIATPDINSQAIASQSEENVVDSEKTSQNSKTSPRRWFSIRIEDRVINNK